MSVGAIKRALHDFQRQLARGLFSDLVTSATVYIQTVPRIISPQSEKAISDCVSTGAGVLGLAWAEQGFLARVVSPAGG
jgi:hypothetical protein